ncbi:MAG: IS66 family insertion sequence element accessory protein TnpA [Longimicrobiales bacterium]
MARKSVEVARITERGYWSEEEARVVLEVWQESGETMASFARRHGVQAKRVARWVRRLQESEERARPGFLPVRVARRRDPDSGRVKSGIELVRRGWRVRIAAGFVAEDLERVLEVVELRGRRC